MKTRLVLAFLALAFLPTSANEAEQLYRQGKIAMEKGEIKEARTAFKQALKLKPDHPYARYELAQLDVRKNELIARKRTNELAAVKLPEINLASGEFADAIHLLGEMIRTESAKQGEEVVPNFVIQDPAGELSGREVSLRVKSVPATAALGYLLDQAGATVRYDEFATVIRPASQTSTPKVKAPSE